MGRAKKKHKIEVKLLSTSTIHVETCIRQDETCTFDELAVCA